MLKLYNIIRAEDGWAEAEWAEAGWAEGEMG